VKAIETVYAGCRFRSRLEARWAVFFDTLGMEWQYEPQGFELENGTRYLPDFWLPECNTWFEVKGVPPTDREQATLIQFARELPGPGMPEAWSTDGLRASEYLKVAVGDIPEHPASLTYVPRSLWTPGYIWRVLVEGSWVNIAPRCWQCCPSDHRYVGWGWCWRCAIGDEEDGMQGAHAAPRPSILAAHGAARSARFEHGERGAR